MGCSAAILAAFQSSQQKKKKIINKLKVTRYKPFYNNLIKKIATRRDNNLIIREI